ncbi:MAG: sigma-54 dependent transcriptional regulator [bacterium]
MLIRVLIVDDEKRILTGLSKALESMNYYVETTTSPIKALNGVENKNFDVLITDLIMPHMDGIELLEKVKDKAPELPVIILTGHGTIESAVKAMRGGAYDYITKPFNLEEVDLIVKRAVEHSRLIGENIRLKNQLTRKQTYMNLVGESAAMQEVYRMIDRVKDIDTTVLIVGESGTGKELIAKAIHYGGQNPSAPLVIVDCAALTPSLLESELFGHIKGAFTGAYRDKAGYFEAANGGTIFLDEIGEFNYPLQTRLLRVLQEGEFSRVGDHRLIKVNVRVIAATNTDLDLAVREGRFREDLLYRLNVITIKVPPLRARTDDIPTLTDHFINKFSQKLKKRILGISDDALECFRDHPWHGNVRELENVIEQAITFCDEDVIQKKHLPETMRASELRSPFYTEPLDELTSVSYKEAKKKLVGNFTREYLNKLLGDFNGNVTAAARQAGIDRTCFYRMLRKFRKEEKK